MQSFSALTLFALLAVVSSRTLDNPLETVSARCFSQAEPHLRSLHLSMHAHRQRVHEQCHTEQAEIGARMEQQEHSVQQSLDECLQSAHNLAAENPVTAAELVLSCHVAADKIRQSFVGFVNESAALHESCAYRLQHVDVEMRASSSRLFHVLARCAPQHACILLRMSQLKVTKLSHRIASVSNLDVEQACALPTARLSHDLRRACERYTATRGIVEDTSASVYRSLHDTLSHHCDALDESAQATVEAPAPSVETEVDTAMPLFPVQVEDVEDQGTIPYGDDMVHEVHQLVTEVYDQMPTEHMDEEIPTEVVDVVSEIIHEMPSLPVEGWNPALGIGPVKIDDTMLAGQKDAGAGQEIGAIGQAAVDDVGLEEDSSLSSSESDSSDDDDADVADVAEPSSAQDEHRHHGRHGHKLIVLAVATGCVCLIVCAVAAAVATKMLRRRHRNAIPQQPEKRGDVVKRALLDDDDEIRQIEQKGFENPTYKHFEHLEEEV